MKHLFAFIFVALTHLLWSQPPTVWKSYYAKYDLYSFADMGNELWFSQADQLIRFDKSSGYFQYDKMPDTILPCLSYHEPFRVVLDKITNDPQGNVWLSTTKRLNSGLIIYPEPYQLWKYDGSTWANFSPMLASHSIEPSLMPLVNGNDWWFQSPTKGLCRYDGNTMIIWDTLNSNLPSYNYTSELVSDGQGNVWFSLDYKGAVKFDGTTFTIFDTTALGISPPWGYFYPRGMFYNPYNQSVYLTVYSDTGYYSYNGITWQHHQIDTTGLQSFYYLSDMLFKDSNTLYMPVVNGILVEQNGTQTFFQIPNTGNGNNYYPYGCKLDASGNLWFSLNNKLVMFDGSSYFSYNDEKAQLLSNLGLFQIIDRAGKHWLSYWGNGGEGLSVINSSTFYNYTNQNSNFTQNYVALGVDTFNNIWLGPPSWGDPVYFDGDSIRPAGTSTNVSYNSITAIAFDKNNVGYFGGSNAGTDNGFVKFENGVFTQPVLPANVNHPTYTAMAVDSTNNLWIGTFPDPDTFSPYPPAYLLKYDGQVFTQYTTSNSGLPSAYIQSLAVDAQNRLWIGTKDRGIAIFDGSSWLYYDSTNTPLPSNHIEGFFFKDNKVYIGTQGNGFAVFDGVFWQVYTTQNSPLVNSDCESVLEDDRCNVWIATECGLSEIVGECNNELKVLYGKVHDQEGTPVAASLVHLMKLSPVTGQLIPIDHTYTDLSGSYSFATDQTPVYVHVLPDRNYFPDVMPGYEDSSLVQQSAQPITITNQSYQKNVICKNALPQSGNVVLEGTVVAENYKPKFALRLLLMANGEPVSTCVTEPNGHYQFAGIQPGVYQIWSDYMGVNNQIGPTLSLSNSASSAALMLHPTYLELLTSGLASNSGSIALNLYPNPASDYLLFNIDKPELCKATITVTNISGQAVWVGETHTGLNRISIAFLNTGIYFLEVRNSSYSARQKFSVQK